MQENQNFKGNNKILTQNSYPNLSQPAPHSNEILDLLSKLNDSFPKNQELTTLFSDLKILIEHSNFGLENKENIENYKNQRNEKEPKLETNKSALIKKFLKNSPSIPKTNIKMVHSDSLRSLESSQSPRLISKKLANLATIDMTTDIPALTLDSDNNLESVESLPITSRSEDLQTFRVSASNLIRRMNPKKNCKAMKASNFKKNKKIGNRSNSGYNNIFSTYYESKSMKDSDTKALEENSKEQIYGNSNHLFNSEYYENSKATNSNIKINERLKNVDPNHYSQEENKNMTINCEKCETGRESILGKVDDQNFSKLKYLYKYPFRKVGDTVASLKFYKQIYHKLNGEHHKCSSNCEYLKRCYKNKDLRSSCSPKEELRHNKVVIDKLPLIFE